MKNNTTLSGTCHFVSLNAAIAYYQTQDNDTRAGALDTVRAKCKDGSIAIGHPKLKAGQSLSVNDEGRYILTGPV